MKSNNRPFPWMGILVATSAFSAACSSSQPQLAASCTPTASSNSVTSSTAVPTGNNVMTVTVNGSLCDPNVQNQYPNEPCTSVQVCTPGGSCATINNLLVDTGSVGLRGLLLRAEQRRDHSDAGHLRRWQSRRMRGLHGQQQ